MTLLTKQSEIHFGKTNVEILNEIQNSLWISRRKGKMCITNKWRKDKRPKIGMLNYMKLNYSSLALKRSEI